MQLLLIRHAIAEDRDEFAKEEGRPDAERPLTDYGRRRMQKNTKGLRRVAPKLDQLVTSPYVRAADTAKIVAKGLGVEEAKELAVLTPEHHPREFFEWMADQNPTHAIGAVGHDPHLSQLLSWCLTGGLDAQFVIKKGGVALISWDDVPTEGHGILRWLISPGHLRAMAD